MQRLNFQTIKEEQLIDTRLQKEFQAGSLRQAINIPTAKFEKLAPRLLDIHRPIVFIVPTAAINDLPQLEQEATKLGFETIHGYLLVEELGSDHLHQTPTLSAKDFLETKTDYLLLDVRDQATVTKPAPKKNLVTLSIKDLATNFAELDPDKEIFTLCGSGNSATTAASFLNKQGRKATVIEGGMTAIQKAQENKH
ncbi:rhodanese-like domain-containing protein [Enterococcus sp. LJL98]